MNDPTVQSLIDEAVRLQAEDGFSKPRLPVGSAWFRLYGLPDVRWITTERRGLGGGAAALVMDGRWHQAVVPNGPGGRGVLAFVVLLAEHVHDRPALSALTRLILAGGHVRLVEQSAEYVQCLVDHIRANPYVEKPRKETP